MEPGRPIFVFSDSMLKIIVLESEKYDKLKKSCLKESVVNIEDLLKESEVGESREERLLGALLKLKSLCSASARKWLSTPVKKSSKTSLPVLSARTFLPTRLFASMKSKPKVK